MRQKIALSWVFPAAIILLLHTLIPHSHDFISHDEHQTCEHHQHNFWEFVEHLLEQNCGENHLEHYQTAFENDLDNDNSLISNQLPQFKISNDLVLIKKPFPATDYNLKNPCLLKNLTYRGPPFV